MITSASHCDRSAFFTSSRAWFWCSDGKKHETRETNKRHKTSNVEKKGSKQKTRARAGKRGRLPPWPASGAGSGEIRQKRDSISSHHISPSRGYSTAPRQLSSPASICGRQISACVCVCVCVCVFAHCVHVSVH